MLLELLQAGLVFLDLGLGLGDLRLVDGQLRPGNIALVDGHDVAPLRVVQGCLRDNSVLGHLLRALVGPLQQRRHTLPKQVDEFEVAPVIRTVARHVLRSAFTQPRERRRALRGVKLREQLGDITDPFRPVESRITRTHLAPIMQIDETADGLRRQDTAEHDQQQAHRE